MARRHGSQSHPSSQRVRVLCTACGPRHRPSGSVRSRTSFNCSSVHGGAEIRPRESPQHHDRCQAACCGRLAVEVTSASLTGTNANALCLPFGLPPVNKWRCAEVKRSSLPTPRRYLDRLAASGIWRQSSYVLAGLNAKCEKAHGQNCEARVSEAHNRYGVHVHGQRILGEFTQWAQLQDGYRARC